jgi:hypothetical protein
VERAEPELERTARRARRVLWAVRLLFYSGAALTAFLLLTGGGEAGDERTWLTGRTDQGEAVRVWVRDGEPMQVRTTLVGTCPDGSEWTHTWQFGSLTYPHPLKREGDVYVGRQTYEESYESEYGPFTGRSELTLRAHVDDGEVTGRLWLVQTNWYDDRPARRYPCKSGAVDFSAQR